MFNRGKKDEATDTKPAGAPAETPLPLRPILQTPTQRPETPPAATPTPSFRPELARRTPEPVAAPTRAPAATGTETPPRRAPAETKKLIVGREIELNGKITACDLLIVEGRVEATLDSRVLEIAEHGVFQGTIAVDQAEIRGRFEGEITVRKQLIVHASGKVSGKVRYAKIKMEEGAEIAGDLAVLDKSASAINVTTKRVANA